MIRRLQNESLEPSYISKYLKNIKLNLQQVSKLLNSVLMLMSLFSITSSMAQVVSLNSSELEKVKQLIHSNEDARSIYSSYVDMANASLNATPNPIASLTSEGKLKGDPAKTATLTSIKDFKKMYSLAVVYRISGNSSYLNAVKRFLINWATINKPSANPINDTNLDQAIEAYDLVKEKLPKADRTLIEQWLKETAKAQIDNKHKIIGTNWNSHRLKIVGEIAYAINSKSLIKWTKRNFTVQISRNLLPDGSSIDYKMRDAITYHVYDLEPLLQTAILLTRATGENYYTYVSNKNSSLKKSVDWLVPYLAGEKTHGEYVHSTIKFDFDRARNNEAGHEIGAQFNPEKGVKVLLLSSYFDPSYTRTTKAIKKTGNDFFDWICVLNAVRK